MGVPAHPKEISLIPFMNFMAHPHGFVVGGALLIAPRQPPELLAAIDQALDAVAETVHRSIEGACAAFSPLARDGDADAMLARILPNPPAAVAFISNDPVRAVCRAARPHALDLPTHHQLREDRRLVLLPGCSHQGEQLTVSLCTKVHVGAEPTLAAP
jgi:hypothetical protein